MGDLENNNLQIKAARVALLQAVPKPLTYLVPNELNGLECGMAVSVPLGAGYTTGYLVELLTEIPDEGFTLKPIRDISHKYPRLPASHVKFLVRAAAYYQVPVADLLALSLPPGQREKERYQLSAQYPDLINNIRLGALELQLCQAIPAEKAVSMLALSRQLKRPVNALKTAIKRLVGKKLVELVLPKQAGPRLVQTVKPIITFELEQLAKKLESKAPKAVELWRQLEADNAVPVAAIKDVSSVYAKVKWLEEHGFVELSTALVNEQGEAEFTADNSATLAQPMPLNDQQRAALEKLTSQVSGGVFKSYLLHGITGSGKTEVYMQAIARVLSQGKKALVLVPEIALTPQTKMRFMMRFGQDRIGLWHSELSEGARADIWQRAVNGQLDVLVGARSALFVPMADLGMVVVDEEHDYSYKQGEEPRYNGRDLAILLAQLNGAVAVLGSATPSLESYNNALAGKMEYVAMTRRATAQTLPQVELIDMRRHIAKAVDGQLSQPLVDALADNLEKGQQSLLFLNRRGFAPTILCPDCGYKFNCPNCAISLTLHQKKHTLDCHYCDYTQPFPEECPACKQRHLLRLGVGTERLEDILQRLFPKARLARLDRDTAGSRIRLEEILAAVNKGEVDILLGTQMVSKGHDFPNVTLVGVLQADAALNFPDFRAAERTFQLITQVAGRAGRGSQAGRVLVQAFEPDNFAIRAALAQDCQAFWQEELNIRREVGYPPFSSLAMLRFEGEDENSVSSCATAIALYLRQRAVAAPAGSIIFLGPAPAPIERINGRYRYQLLIKCRNRSHLPKLLAGVRSKAPAAVHLIVDIDPIDML